MNKQWERTKLRIFAGGSIVSIVICGLTLILWVASFFFDLQLSVRNGAGTRYALLTVPNAIGWVTVHQEPPGYISMNGATQPGSASTTPPATATPLHWFWQKPTLSSVGFGRTTGQASVYYEDVNGAMTSDYVGHFAPGWMVVALSLVGPVWWFTAQRRRAHRFEHNLCTYCGADMSTSPYRCPKCGREQPW